MRTRTKNACHCCLLLLKLLLSAGAVSSLNIPNKEDTCSRAKRPAVSSIGSPLLRHESSIFRNGNTAPEKELTGSAFAFPVCLLAAPAAVVPALGAQALSIPSVSDPISISSPGIVDLPFVGGVLTDDGLFTGPQGIVLAYLLVSISDCIPFLPCQPLAIALGAKLGFGAAFPVTVLGQTTAGIAAFAVARGAADSDLVRTAAEGLSPEAAEKFEEFRRIGGVAPPGEADVASEEGSDPRSRDRELKVLLALIGLRLAPFFPFSAGNYLLGGATSVPLSLFVVATLLGSTLSNFISTSIGAGGADWLSHVFTDVSN